MKYPTDADMCFKVDIKEKLTVETFKEEHFKFLLEACVIQSNSTTKANIERRKSVNYLEATPQVSNTRRTKFMEPGKSSATLVPSIKEPSNLELKQLPSHLSMLL